MDPRLLEYYERELRYIREIGGEFASQFPKIAGRLGIDSFECADPYVERLLEAFAFLAARVQLKVDSQFPQLTQYLLESIYPHYLAPTPSMAVVKLIPNLREGSLSGGFVVPRGTALRGHLGKKQITACEYRTAHEVTLWPLEIVKAEYAVSGAELSDVKVKGAKSTKAKLTLHLRTTAGLTFSQLALQSIPLFICGNDEIAVRIYEQLVSSATALLARPKERPSPWSQVIDEEDFIRPLGFDDDQALLPYGPRSFQGYRLLHEYFAFSSRFLFVEFRHLAPVVTRCTGSDLELIVLFDKVDMPLEGLIDASRFALFCSPIINLFPRKADRIQLSDMQHEYHVVPDRTRPMDLEVHTVAKVVGTGSHAESEQEFRPLYASDEYRDLKNQTAYYAINRKPRVLSSRQRVQGTRTSYIGSEVFLSLVDAEEGPFRTQLKQLAVNLLCTNRDLPLHMVVGQSTTDFTVQSGAPVEAVRCIAGPTAPRPSFIHSRDHGSVAWRLINHLSLNYLSLTDSDDKQGAAGLRELLMLYSDLSDSPSKILISGVRSVKSKSITRPLPVAGPISFGRGVEVILTCDESAFAGTGAFLLGAVLEKFFAKYVSINSFTETVLKTVQRGEIKRWPVRIGRRHVL